MKKVALITGINKYAPSWGPISLSGCVKDAERMEKLLTKRGYETNVAFDDQVKKASLELYIRHLMPTQAGDMFVWYHSGHGTYAFRDGKESCGSVLYDRVLWDYEVAQLIKRITPKGVKLVFAKDTCYSEGSSRFADEVSNLKNKGMVTSKCLPLSQLRAEKAEAEIASFEPLDVSFTGELFTFFELASCRRDQVSYEVSSGGVFTSALIKVMNGNGAATPDRISASIQLKMGIFAGKQQPICTTIVDGNAMKRQKLF